MQTDYIVYDPATGDVLKAGTAPSDMVAAQAGEGQAAIAVPPGTIAWPAPRLDLLKAALADAIDQAAVVQRSKFVTIAPGQDATYIYKANEARAFQANSAATVPMLTAEAAARNMTVADLAAEVLQVEAQWIAIAAKIEAARMGAKSKLSAATTIPAIVAAATIDWSAATAA